MNKKNETIENQKVVGECRLSYSYCLNDDGETIKFELSANDDLFNLINSVVVKESLTEYFLNTDKRQRYKIKSVIRNSYYWCDVFNLFFDKEFIDNGRVILKLSNIERRDRILRNIKDEFKHLLKELIEVNRMAEIKEVEMTFKEVK
jgi:uncharacterized membrane protein YgaE (UPF0421/DUF939 family)